MSNIIARLNQRIAEVKRMGFEVRTEWLNGPAATWCMIGQQKVIFLDLSQNASEKLLQLNQVIESYNIEMATHQRETSNPQVA